MIKIWTLTWSRKNGNMSGSVNDCRYNFYFYFFCYLCFYFYFCFYYSSRKQLPQFHHYLYELTLLPELPL